MNITLIIILVLIFGLILGPIMMLRPNPAQRRVEFLRSSARKKGIHFSLRKVPQQASELVQSDPVAVYFCPLKKNIQSANWMLVRTQYPHDIHFLGWWAWQTNERPAEALLSILTSHLPGLSSLVFAVSISEQGVCIYWSEKGGEEELEKIIALLDELKNAS